MAIYCSIVLEASIYSLLPLKQDAQTVTAAKIRDSVARPETVAWKNPNETRTKNNYPQNWWSNEHKM